MAAKGRLTDSPGNSVPFSCGNTRFCTNIAVGKLHGMSATRGSVLDSPHVDHNGASLWLEHVEEIGTGKSFYWLMWYDNSASPTIPLSSIFDKSELAEMAKQLVQFVP